MVFGILYSGDLAFDVDKISRNNEALRGIGRLYFAANLQLIRNFRFRFLTNRQITPERLRMQPHVGFSTLGAADGHGRQPFSLPVRPELAKRSLLPPDCSETLPSPARTSPETCSVNGSAYPVGKGSALIRRSMAPNSRRVRWLWASNSQ